MGNRCAKPKEEIESSSFKKLQRKLNLGTQLSNTSIGPSNIVERSRTSNQIELPIPRIQSVNKTSSSQDTVSEELKSNGFVLPAYNKVQLLDDISSSQDPEVTRNSVTGTEDIPKSFKWSSQQIIRKSVSLARPLSPKEPDKNQTKKFKASRTHDDLNNNIVHGRRPRQTEPVMNIRNVQSRSQNVKTYGSSRAPFAPPVFISGSSRHVGKNPVDRLKNLNIVEQLTYFPRDNSGSCRCGTKDIGCGGTFCNICEGCNYIEMVNEGYSPSPTTKTRPVTYTRTQCFSFKHPNEQASNDGPPYKWPFDTTSCNYGTSTFDEIPVGKNPQCTYASNSTGPIKSNKSDHENPVEMLEKESQDKKNVVDVLPGSTGIYFYDADTKTFCKTVPPSPCEPERPAPLCNNINSQAPASLSRECRDFGSSKLVNEERVPKEELGNTMQCPCPLTAPILMMNPYCQAYLPFAPPHFLPYAPSPKCKSKRRHKKRCSKNKHRRNRRKKSTDSNTSFASETSPTESTHEANTIQTSTSALSIKSSSDSQGEAMAFQILPKVEQTVTKTYLTSVPQTLEIGIETDPDNILSHLMSVTDEKKSLLSHSPDTMEATTSVISQGQENTKTINDDQIPAADAVAALTCKDQRNSVFGQSIPRDSLDSTSPSAEENLHTSKISLEVIPEEDIVLYSTIPVANPDPPNPSVWKTIIHRIKESTDDDKLEPKTKLTAFHNNVTITKSRELHVNSSKENPVIIKEQQLTNHNKPYTSKTPLEEENNPVPGSSSTGTDKIKDTNNGLSTASPCPKPRKQSLVNNSAAKLILDKRSSEKEESLRANPKYLYNNGKANVQKPNILPDVNLTEVKNDEQDTKFMKHGQKFLRQSNQQLEVIPEEDIELEESDPSSSTELTVGEPILDRNIEELIAGLDSLENSPEQELNYSNSTDSNMKYEEGKDDNDPEKHTLVTNNKNRVITREHLFYERIPDDDLKKFPNQEVQIILNPPNQRCTITKEPWEDLNYTEDLAIYESARAKLLDALGKLKQRIEEPPYYCEPKVEASRKPCKTRFVPQKRTQNCIPKETPKPATLFIKSNIPQVHAISLEGSSNLAPIFFSTAICKQLEIQQTHCVNINGLELTRKPSLNRGESLQEDPNTIKTALFSGEISNCSPILPSKPFCTNCLVTSNKPVGADHPIVLRNPVCADPPNTAVGITSRKLKTSTYYEGLASECKRKEFMIVEAQNNCCNSNKEMYADAELCVQPKSQIQQLITKYFKSCPVKHYKPVRNFKCQVNILNKCQKLMDCQEVSEKRGHRKSFGVQVNQLPCTPQNNLPNISEENVSLVSLVSEDEFPAANLHKMSSNQAVVVQETSKWLNGSAGYEYNVSVDKMAKSIVSRVNTQPFVSTVEIARNLNLDMNNESEENQYPSGSSNKSQSSYEPRPSLSKKGSISRPIINSTTKPVEKLAKNSGSNSIGPQAKKNELISKYINGDARQSLEESQKKIINHEPQTEVQKKVAVCRKSTKTDFENSIQRKYSNKGPQPQVLTENEVKYSKQSVEYSKRKTSEAEVSSKIPNDDSNILSENSQMKNNNKGLKKDSKNLIGENKKNNWKAPQPQVHKEIRKHSIPEITNKDKENVDNEPQDKIQIPSTSQSQICSPNSDKIARPIPQIGGHDTENINSELAPELEVSGRVPNQKQKRKPSISEESDDVDDVFESSLNDEPFADSKWDF